MAYKDIEAVLGAEVALNTQAVSTDTTTNGEAINLSGFEGVLFVPFAGALTDGGYTPLIQESDDSNISNATNVADADLLPSGTGQEASAALDTSNTASKIGYRGTKQYVFCSLVSANTTTGGDVGVVAIKGHPKQAPVS